jgi:dTMP kinase
MPEGILVAVEGIDGAGKTTQVRLLAEVLRDAGQDVLTSKEPTDGPHGRRIRASALSGRLSPEEELDEFIKDREEHLRTKIRPALAAGKIVILDRYFYSTIAYQGPRDGGVERLDSLMRELADTPDLTVVLDVEPATGLARVTGRDGQPNEFEKADALAASRKVFLHLCAVDPVCVEVNGGRNVQDVHRDIVHVFMARPFFEKRCAKAHGCDDPDTCEFNSAGTCDFGKVRDALSPGYGELHPAISKTSG